MPDRLSVLLAGKGPPERGGIPAFLTMLQESRLGEEFDLTFLNLAAGREERLGGRANVTNLSRTLADAGSVYRAARGRDVVHLHSALAPAVTLVRAGVLAAAARAGGAAVVVHAHGGLIQLWLTGRLRRLLVKIALRPAHVVLAVSRGAEVALRRADPRVELLRNGIDTERFHPETGSTSAGAASDEGHVPTILFVGNLTPRKGVLDLFAASRSLLERGLAHRLVLAGGVPDEGQEAERQVRAAQPPNAELLGSVTSDAVLAELRHADVFCLPSWWEAMPLSVLEAMAAGVPVVATAVGDVPELLADGAGVVVPVKDPAALADALTGLLRDPDLRRSLGVAGRERVATSYPLAATVAGLSGVYRRVARRTER